MYIIIIYFLMVFSFTGCVFVSSTHTSSSGPVPVSIRTFRLRQESPFSVSDKFLMLYYLNYARIYREYSNPFHFQKGHMIMVLGERIKKIRTFRGKILLKELL